MRRRIAIVGHQFVNALNRDKLDWLARESDFDVHVIVPARWIGNLGERYFPGNAATPDKGPPTLDTVEHRPRIIPLPVHFAGVNRMQRYVFGPSLARVLRDIAPDLIHLEEEPYSAVALQIALARAVAGRPPMVITSYQNRATRYPLPVRLAERYVLASATRAIAGTAQVEAVLRQKGYGGPIERLGYGTDVRLFHPPASRQAAKAAIGLDGPTPTVGFVGRLCADKGVDVLLDAASVLHPRPRILIVGAGDAELPLRRRAQRLGCESDITWTGRVDHRDVPKYLAAMDLLVLPSRNIANFSEQFGRVLVEAMACGVVVVGSSTGGIPEVIGRTGRTFPEGDAAALARILHELLVEPSTRDRLAACALARLPLDLSNESAAARLRGIYERAIHDGREVRVSSERQGLRPCTPPGATGPWTRWILGRKAFGARGRCPLAEVWRQRLHLIG